MAIPSATLAITSAIQYVVIVSDFNICHNDIMAITFAIALNRGYKILGGLTSTTTS